jgi:hypothetical protein
MGQHRAPPPGPNRPQRAGDAYPRQLYAWVAGARSGTSQRQRDIAWVVAFALTLLVLLVFLLIAVGDPTGAAAPGTPGRRETVTVTYPADRLPPAVARLQRP